MTVTKHTHLRCVGDAAFKREGDTGHCLRGALYLRGSGCEKEDFSGTHKVVHVLDWACRRQRHVTRSTFAAELLSAGDTVDQGVVISQMIHEIENGYLSPTESRKLREEGGFAPLALYLDAMSVFAAITATFIKIPAEKSLLSHVQYVRELLDRKVLKYLFWIDTRDMYADGLTKGSVQRAALHFIMEGIMGLAREYRQWASKAMIVDGRPTTETRESSYMVTCESPSG